MVREMKGFGSVENERNQAWQRRTSLDRDIEAVLAEMSADLEHEFRRGVNAIVQRWTFQWQHACRAAGETAILRSGQIPRAACSVRPIAPHPLNGFARLGGL